MTKDVKRVSTKVDNSTIGDWSDRLGANEVDFSVKAGAEMHGVKWAEPLLQDVKISRALKIVPNPERTLPELNEFKSALFEVRFAYALHKAGVSAQYEYRSGVGKTSVDFCISGNQKKPGWLIELTSLRDSDAVKENTLWKESHFEYAPEPFSPNENLPRVRDIVKSQQAILSKVANNKGKPIKFPVPDGKAYHLVIVDIRGFNAGNSDFFDYYTIAYGSEGLKNVVHGAYCKKWIDENGQSEYIRGIFDPNYPASTGQYLRERIHAIGFIREKEYTESEINSSFILFPNPHLIPQNEFKTFRFLGWKNYRDIKGGIKGEV